MKKILSQIVQNGEVHAKWLNTLSYLENAGARKISACEHWENVDLIQLKHAAEEHRHAFYLKKQIRKLLPIGCETYQPHELLAATATRHYLHKLDVFCSRYIKDHFQLKGPRLKYTSYLFVTYAIEKRADLLYPEYQLVLQEAKAKVMVRSIIAEEEGHLEEMIDQLQRFDSRWQQHMAGVTEYEEQLFEEWLGNIQNEVSAYAIDRAALA